MDFFDLTPDGPSPFADGVLDRNLRAIATRSPRTAELIRAAAPRPDVTFVDTPEGVPSASIEETTDDTGTGAPAFTDADPLGLDLPAAQTKTRWLASRRRPLAEAARFADTVDLDANGAACVLGFGLGYHCRVLAERWRERGVVVCFEPDVGLLRAVLEKIDHAEWIEKGHVVVLTDPDDAPSLNRAVRGVESVITLGATIAEHPASAGRVGAAGQRFAQTFADVLGATRTTVVTTLVQSEVTLRNMLMNLDRYATGRGVAELAGAAAGRPAIVVSAGPSLARNIDQVAAPGVRDRFVIIATQTTLKPLLRAGVKPHFVTALDYHEISRRFYEGLTERDVEGVTLVAESKANPAILDAFPGHVRCPADDRLRDLLGPDLPASPGTLPPGATVAHLAYFLARHLGCDPVILIGQDLGFTDGQYYASGASIHDVWASELGPFRTLEQFEWERIVRQRRLLHRRTDVLGRPIYTDEQMSTYLQQFEVEFASDDAVGRRVIDATEGGVAKKGTVAMTLAQAIETFAGEPINLPDAAEPLHTPEARLPKLAAHLRRVRTDAHKVAKLSRDAKAVLQRMLKNQTDQARVSKLIAEVYGLRDEVRTLEPAYGLVQFLNQTGTLNRYRADRSIELADEADAKGLGELDRQRRQIDRDIRNVEWLAMAADVLEDLLDDSVGVIEQRKDKTTRDDAPETEQRVDPSVRTAETRRVGVVLAGDLDTGGLGIARDLARPIASGRNALQLTLDRAKRVEGAAAIVVATPDPERARALAGDAGEGVAFEMIDPMRTRSRIAGVAAARRWSPASWRGGLGSMSCYDETCDLRDLAQVMDRRSLTDAAVIGLDWALVDPTLIDRGIDASRGRADGKRLAISQAAPGLGTIVIDRLSIESLAKAAGHAGPMASLGGVLGYIPVAPVSDPIGRGVCVAIDPAVRDLGRRMIADTPEAVALIGQIAGALGSGVAFADAAAVATLAGELAPEPASPRHLTLELCTGRLASGPWGQWRRGSDDLERRPIDLALALRTIEQLAGARPDAVLTLDGAGDPLLHPACLEIVQAARAAGVAGVHVRTDLLRDDIDTEALAACGADVISVDMLAVDPGTYAGLTGVDAYERTKARLEALLAHRPMANGATDGGLRTPWILPRITRCDEVQGQIEPFYDGWLMAAGVAQIDPMPEAAPTAGRRITPLALPALWRERLGRDEIAVQSDGLVAQTDIDLRTTPLEEAWRRVRRVRTRGDALIETSRNAGTDARAEITA